MSKACERCNGCGRIADTEDGEPWTAWTSHRLMASAAVLLRIVRPVKCPDCNGTGELESARASNP
jgi:hypothetical protein